LNVLLKRKGELAQWFKPRRKRNHFGVSQCLFKKQIVVSVLVKVRFVFFDPFAGNGEGFSCYWWSVLVSKIKFKAGNMDFTEISTGIKTVISRRTGPTSLKPEKLATSLRMITVS
jgi:hypothetical protein